MRASCLRSLSSSLQLETTKLSDNEIDLAGLQALEGLKDVNIKLHVCQAVFTLGKVCPGSLPRNPGAKVHDLEHHLAAARWSTTPNSA